MKHIVSRMSSYFPNRWPLIFPIASNVLLVENVKKELNQHRSDMHPGFYFFGDNIDMRSNVRHMTMKNQNKDEHMFQI